MQKYFLLLEHNHNFFSILIQIICVQYILFKYHCTNTFRLGCVLEIVYGKVRILICLKLQQSSSDSMTGLKIYIFFFYLINVLKYLLNNVINVI